MITSSTHWRQIALVVGLAVAASGCSTIASLDPTGLLGGSSDSSPASQFPADQAAPTTTPDQAAGTTPDLASIPARPEAISATQQQQTAQSLASDGAQARYSADALRGGTEAAAAPPPASAAAPTAAQQLLGSSATAANAADAPPTAEPAPPPQVATNARPSAAAQTTAPALPDGAQPAPAANVPVGNAAVPPSSRGGNVQTASMTPAASPVGPSSAAVAPMGAPRGEPAVPAVPANAPMRGSMMAQPQLSDAALGFKASDAPPLDASVNNFVSAPIVAHYRQTASNSEMANTMTAAAVPARGAGAGSDTGIVTNMAAVSGAPAAIAAMNGGVAPTAVIYFPGDGTNLSTAARAEVRTAVAAFKASGGQGAIRVVGHASSRTGNMPVEKHLETIFDKSQARANAVAQELIHDGVPASRVLVDAVGDSQPIYYESMPQGEEGNRRAEIFVQS
ncbi:MAG TPA: OmpA family protein [Rhizomicrobium sp.]|nr:OmpA family protein [Rhizomicrobium sp.]